MPTDPKNTLHPTLRQRTVTGGFASVRMADIPLHLRYNTVGVAAAQSVAPHPSPAPSEALSPLVQPTWRDRAAEVVRNELTPHAIIGRVSTAASMLPGPTHGWDAEHARHQSHVAMEEASSAWSALKQGNLSGAVTMGVQAVASTARAATGVAPVAAVLHSTGVPFASEVADRTAQAVHALMPSPVGPIKRPGPKEKMD
ncbi:hypothetical protein DWV00_32500 [Trinickia dinghuensis]|uniref:Uncharacterized protein n=1 Tax=Trinickia dinghuensis TaxID=2291023 RepID=A0A3D8JPT5_9BURK|nr:hypothetical protein DWV00_32500 [Trinickia dinghuensis]